MRGPDRTTRVPVASACRTQDEVSFKESLIDRYTSEFGLDLAALKAALADGTATRAVTEARCSGNAGLARRPASN